MEDAKARDLKAVCEFVGRLTGADVRRASDVSELWRVQNAADRLLTSLKQPQQPEPLALERLPEILDNLVRNDDALSTALNERCGALEARIDSLEARMHPLGAGPGRGDRYTRDEDRHQGLSDPMG